MLLDIFASILQAAIVVAILSAVIYLFVKKPMVLVCTIAVALVFAGVIVAPSVAEGTIEAQGYITRVAPEFFDGHPCLIVTVETFDGEVYTYFAEEEINTQGIVTIVLFGDEVVDVF